MVKDLREEREWGGFTPGQIKIVRPQDQAEKSVRSSRTDLQSSWWRISIGGRWGEASEVGRDPDEWRVQEASWRRCVKAELLCHLMWSQVKYRLKINYFGVWQLLNDGKSTFCSMVGGEVGLIHSKESREEEIGDREYGPVFKIPFYYWRILALRYCVSFCCVMKWISYMYK